MRITGLKQQIYQFPSNKRTSGGKYISMEMLIEKTKETYYEALQASSIGWHEGENSYETKYPYVCHAELNAILNNRGTSLEGCSIYVALFPCCECAKAIIQSGIKKVLYISDKYGKSDSVRSSKRMFDAAGVKYEQIRIDHKKIEIDFSENLI